MKTEKPFRVFIDQYNQVYRARTIKELRAKVGGTCSKMYTDKADGSTTHIGYVIGHHWLQEFAPVEKDE